MKISKFFIPIILILVGAFCFTRLVFASDYLAEYWDTAAVATPSMPVGAPNATTTVSDIDINWGSSGPFGGDGDGFIARYTKTIGAGQYTFFLGSDDGIRMYIDNTYIMGMWVDQAYKTTSGSYTIPSGDSHTLRVEYYENAGGAQVYFAYNQTITATYSANSHGSISGTSNQNLTNGASSTPVTAVPDSGYHFVNWSDGSTANPRVDSGLTSNFSVSANFEINPYIVNYLAGSGGSISGSSTQSVISGSSTTPVSPVANTGYTFLKWDDNSTSTSRFDSNILSNATHTAEFLINTYTINYLAGSNGSISGSSTQLVNYGASASAINAIPNNGYHFSSWNDSATSSSRTDTNISSNQTYTATFSINTYSVNYIAKENGYIKGLSNQTIDHASDALEVTATPNNGYHFVNWSDGETSATRKDMNIISDKSFTANFEINSSAPVSLPNAIGSGLSDIAIAMNTSRDINTINTGGTNVLAYINSQAIFTAPESSDNWHPETHSFKITDLDLAKNIITLKISSIPQILTLKKGEEKEVDLDGDNKNDILVSFVDTYINRAEITVKSLAGTNKNEEIKKEIINVKTPVKINQTKNIKYIFKNDLKQGSVGNDVKELQKYLNSNGYIVSKSGIGSKGNESIYFGQATKFALIKYQIANKIFPAQGYLGTISRQLINK